MNYKSNKNTGFSDILIGLQYGDEGKAKVIDLFGHRYDIIARFNGGANAGHTIQTPSGTLGLRQLPSGVLNEQSHLYVGSGCATNLRMLIAELDMVQRQSINLQRRLTISSRALVIQPHHIDFDRRHGSMIGTTGNGIGPCYADRALRAVDGRQVSVSLRDFAMDLEGTLKKIEANAVAAAYQGNKPLSTELAELAEAAQVVLPYVTMDDLFLVNRVQGGARVLFEGAQSVELDVSKGSMPYVTSSHTVPAYAYVGGDLPPKFHRFTIGVAKAVVSRVGNGPMPGEFGEQRSASYCANKAITRDSERKENDPALLLSSSDPFNVGMAIRMLTGEYGVGTGRPRRIGMLDLAQLKRAVSLAGADVLFLNKCDCLGLFSKTAAQTIPIVTGYENGRLEIKDFAAFDVDCSNARRRGDLPPSLLDLLAFVETFVGCPLLGMGFGPDRDRNVISYDLFDLAA